VVFSVGGSFDDLRVGYFIMLAGRIIFSLGGESLSVAQSTFCSRWFKGRELAFSFGVTLSFSRIGSFTNLLVTPALANHLGIQWAIWFGAITCMVSVTLTVIASISDKLKENHTKAALLAAKEEEKPKIPFRLSDIAHFPASLWLIYIICVCFYVPIFTLISISGLQYVQYRVPGVSNQSGNSYLSIPYIMSACLSPFCGFAVDRIGRKPLWLTVASGLMMLTFAILLFFLELDGVSGVMMVIAAMVVLGFSYSLCASSLWPCVPLLVPEERVGTAYAIMNSIQNSGLAIASLVAGGLCDNHPQCSVKPIFFLFVVSMASTGFSFLLILYDLSHGSVLSRKSGKTPAEEAAESERTPLIAADVSVNPTQNLLSAGSSSFVGSGSTQTLVG